MRRQPAAHVAGVLAVALVTWTGIHALRAFWSMLVWNIAEDRPSTQIALIALALWAIGLLAWPAARLLGGRHPAVRFAALFGGVYALDHFIAHPLLTPLLGVAEAITWLWALPAVIVTLARREMLSVFVPGVVLGLAAQIALQSALHGLDLPMLRGLWPGVAATLLGAAVFLSVRHATTEGGPEPHGGRGVPWWRPAVLGPYLLLQVTLLTNLGRLAQLAGTDLPGAAVVAAAGLLAAAGALALLAGRGGMNPVIPLAAGAAAVVVLLSPAWLAGSGVWLLTVAQVGATVAFAGVIRGTGSPGGVYGGIVAAAMLYFVLTFLFYRQYGWPLLWPVMAALVWLPLAARAAGAPSLSRRATAVAAAGVLAVSLVGVGAARAGRFQEATAGPAPAEMKVLDYNIHQGFNFASVPDPEAIARVIERSGADLIALQEVARGWNVNGGADLVAWLSHRFPRHTLVYGPMNGELWGNVILSRYPPKESGAVRFPIRKSLFQRGLVWAIVPTTAGDLLVVNTHFSAYAGFEDDRAGQTEDLLQFWGRRPRTLLVGDLNAGPDDPPVRRLRAEGLVELTEAHGLRDTFTFASGRPADRRDYIFATRDITSTAAAIPRTSASDHLPIEATIRLR